MTKTVPQDTDYPMELDGTVEYIDSEQEDQDRTDQFWVDLAESNFNTAKSFQDIALTSQWERNADHFNNKHYRRSIYNTKQFKGRSRLFRPLTRSAERSSSAQAAAALFSNVALLDVKPENHNDPLQVAAAHVMQELVQYRLTKTIKWYLTCLGAWQDTRVYGPCCTYTWWQYEEKDVERDVPIKDVLGAEIKDGRTETTTEKKVLKDEPVIEMIPPENLLLDPQCDWRDPINSSPHVTRLVPMVLDDVLDRMEVEDTKTGIQPWIKHSEEDILAASNNNNYNAVRQAREGDGRTDKTDVAERNEFKNIWCHENFVRLRGEEYVYWTVGSTLLLTAPTPLEEVYHTGKRPLSYGFSIIEAHKFSPSSPTELISGLQTSVNDIANLRTDNVKLVLNKRYIIRRGAAVDLEALMRSVPGGGVTTDDPERDIKVIDTRDVTGSSYKEQERLETESNDLSGTFMGGSVQNNRSLNETVGGMEMLSEGANVISEFDIRTFIESWLRPQLELLIQYIQAYETEDVIFHNAFESAFKKLGYQYNLKEGEELKEGMKQMSPEGEAHIKNRVLNDKMTIVVNVGLGATSPQKKIDMLSYALKALEPFPEFFQKLDDEEIAKEIFSAAGYQDGSRFIKKEEDGKELGEQDMQQAYEQGLQEGQDKSKMAAVEVQREIGMAKIQNDREMGMANLASKEGLTTRQMADKVGIELKKDQTRRDVAASQSKIKRDEMAFKERTGKQGI
ncbi:MAG: hypothetical protein GY752_08910 [bacterium]|nr:hypothetical protein [bacterium]